MTTVRPLAPRNEIKKLKKKKKKKKKKKQQTDPQGEEKWEKQHTYVLINV